MYSRLCFSSMSSMKSIGNVLSLSELDLEGLVFDEKEWVFCVLLLLMYVLFVVDKDISGSGLVIVGIFICLVCYVLLIFEC